MEVKDLYIENYKTLIEEIKQEKQIPPHMTPWFNLEDMMLSELGKSQKNKQCMIPFI